MSWPPGLSLLQNVHFLENFHLLIDALDFIQTHSDPAPNVQEVKISSDFVVSLAAIHRSPDF